jgi:hypothetical protein
MVTWLIPQTPVEDQRGLKKEKTTKNKILDHDMNILITCTRNLGRSQKRWKHSASCFSVTGLNWANGGMDNGDDKDKSL